MKLELRFPLRFKILVTLLFVVTIVVSMITFTMANLFHKDKKTYIHDLTSVMAVNTAEKTGFLLQGYAERLRNYVLFVTDEDPTENQVERINRLFEDFGEFVAVVIYNEIGEELLTLYDDTVLQEAQLDDSDIQRYREDHPLPHDALISGQVLVENSMLSQKLPCLTMVLAEPISGSEEHVIVAAFLKTDALLGLMGRSELFDVFIIDGRGSLIASSSLRSDPVPPKQDWKREFEGGSKEISVGITQEYAVEGTEMIGGFAPVQFAGISAVVQIPESAAYLASRELLQNLTLLSVGLLAASALFSLFCSRLITRPIEKLSRATQAVGEGDFDVDIDVKSRDEMGELASSFTHMASALKTAQASLIQSEKLAAFGELGAGIAHEVKNPLAGILGCAQLALRKAEPGTTQEKNLRLIEKETRRCTSIIENLLKFARQEKTEKKQMSISPVVEDAVAIVNHQLTLQGVKLEVSVDPNLPQMVGDAGQIEQVLINLMINAQQAMGENPGNIWVSAVRGDDHRIELQVRDNGPGMSEEVRAKIFEPFFTTKPGGKGTGLGLSVSYGIVQDHKGDIVVESAPGKGTTFVLTFPGIEEAGEPGLAA